MHEQVTAVICVRSCVCVRDHAVFLIQHTAVHKHVKAMCTSRFIQALL